MRPVNGLPLCGAIIAALVFAGLAAAQEHVSFATYEKAPEPKELVILDGSAHAQYLFQTNQGARVLREIRQFLSSPWSGVRSVNC